MSVSLMNSDGYLLLRFCLWGIAWIVATLDFCGHRLVKPKGWRLHRSLYTCLTLFVLKEFCYIVYALPKGDDELCYLFLIFFSNAADTMFFLVLMLLASGWCITRSRLGSHKLTISLFPPMYFISSLIIDYIFEYEDGHGTIHGKKTVRLHTDVEADILIVASFVNIFSLVYMWLWIFQSASVERDVLLLRLQNMDLRLKELQASTDSLEEGGHEEERHRLMDGGEHHTVSEQATGTDNDANGGLDYEDMHVVVSEEAARENEGSHAVFLPNACMADSKAELCINDQIVVMRLKEKNLNTTHLPEVAKLRLINKFYFGVTAYCLSLIAIVLYSTWKGTISVLLIIVTDLVTLVFIGCLLIAFRLRDKNPYYLIQDCQQPLPGLDYSSSEDEDDEDSNEAPENSNTTTGSNPVQSVTVDFADGEAVDQKPSEETGSLEGREEGRVKHTPNNTGGD
eukprot:Nk52_evm3s1073 gene=Nk52_evmTU3s1073